MQFVTGRLVRLFCVAPEAIFVIISEDFEALTSQRTKIKRHHSGTPLCASGATLNSSRLTTPACPRTTASTAGVAPILSTLPLLRRSSLTPSSSLLLHPLSYFSLWTGILLQMYKVRKKKCTIGKFENITFQVLFNAWMVWLVWCSKQNNQGIYAIQHVRAFEYFLIDDYYNILYTNHILLWLFLVLFLILVYIFFIYSVDYLSHHLVGSHRLQWRWTAPRADWPAVFLQQRRTKSAKEKLLLLSCRSTMVTFTICIAK